jgi:hypothetical protein
MLVTISELIKSKAGIGEKRDIPVEMEEENESTK